MDENNDYLDLRDAIDVPWDELRSERTLRKILEASAEQPAGVDVDDVEASSQRKPFFMVAAAAILLGAAGMTTVALTGSSPATSEAPLAMASATVEAEASNPARAESVVPERAPEPASSEAKLLEEPAGSLLAFADGAQARLGTNASVRVLNDTPNEIRIDQQDGDVAYEVADTIANKRDVVVQVAHLYIMVQGSHFSASLTDNKVSIEVSEGTVVVDDGKKQLELVGGDSLRLERQARLDEAGVVSTRPERKAKAVHASGQGRPKSRSVDDLMKRADDARQAGDLAASAAALEQIVEGEAEGKVPPVTWMTLGRVERRRGNHEAAAKAFESYWKRFSGRSLAEDALHEAFVSYKAAGRTGEARRVAQTYLEAFPSGLHADQMATYLP